MQSWLWNHTAYEPCKSLPLTDRAFRYGMAIFESLRLHAGQAEFFQPHRQRLISTCHERRFPLDEAALDAAKTLLESKASDGFARIYITAGDGSPASPILAPRIFLFIEPRNDSSPQSFSLRIRDEAVNPVFPGHKTANYWLNCDALHAAQSQGFDEALLFNDHAELLSACCANVFLVHENRITTPSLASGCRAGVIREWILSRRPVTECRIRREDLLRADEIFLSNSWTGILPVTALEGRPLTPHRISERLAAEFQELRAGKFLH